jgi:hypothetical protein
VLYSLHLLAVVVFERLRNYGHAGGLEGGWVDPPMQGFGGSAPENFFWADIFSFRADILSQDDIFPGPHDIRWFFGTWFFADGFLFPVKELGFWTNPGHWVRVLDAAGSYMYIVL